MILEGLLVSVFIFGFICGTFWGWLFDDYAESNEKSFWGWVRKCLKGR